MTETNIILAVIGCVGLLSTLAVYSRANNATQKYFTFTDNDND